jgi:hypothetical protein
LLKTEAAVYDDMSKGRVDASKWKILSFPMGNGETWAWEEPRARFEARNGGLAVTVDAFTRKHDHVHMFDDPKQLYGSTRTLPVSGDGETVFEVEMGAETYRSNADDIRDGFAGFNVMDFSTGMIFDFVSTGKKIGAIYERLLIPGLTDEKTAFTYLIESPFSGIRTEPGKMHNYSVRLDAVRRKAEWACRWKAVLQGRRDTGKAGGDNSRVRIVHSQAHRPWKGQRVYARTGGDRDLEELSVRYRLDQT